MAATLVNAFQRVTALIPYDDANASECPEEYRQYGHLPNLTTTDPSHSVCGRELSVRISQVYVHGICRYHSVAGRKGLGFVEINIHSSQSLRTECWLKLQDCLLKCSYLYSLCIYELADNTKMLMWHITIKLFGPLYLRNYLIWYPFCQQLQLVITDSTILISKISQSHLPFS